MHRETVGAGPPLLLLHGWAMHSGIFAALLPDLARHFTVHLIDLPGHGLSAQLEPNFDLRAIAHTLAETLPGALWLGWSLGGLIALKAALERPRQVRGLALIATSPRFIVANDWPHAVAHSVFAAFARDLASDWRGTVDRFLALECAGSDRAKSELRELRAQVFCRGEPAPQVLGRGLRWLADTDLRAHLPKLECPSLWIAGARDRLVPWPAMQAAATACPRARFVRIEGGGHAPFIGHPDRVLQALDDWRAQALTA